MLNSRREYHKGFDSPRVDLFASALIRLQRIHNVLFSFRFSHCQLNITACPVERGSNPVSVIQLLKSAYWPIVRILKRNSIKSARKHDRINKISVENSMGEKPGLYENITPACVGSYPA